MPLPSPLTQNTPYRLHLTREEALAELQERIPKLDDWEIKNMLQTVLAKGGHLHSLWIDKPETCDCDRTVIHDCICPACHTRFMESRGAFPAPKPEEEHEKNP